MTTASLASSASSTATNAPTLGCVKWFNNKAGYGFVTVTDGESRDIFVHHSSIQVGQSQYRYLVQGEYIELDITHVDNNEHEVQASNVRGVKGGKLMCETRNELRSERQQYTPSVQRQRQEQPQRHGKQHREFRPHLSEDDQAAWMIVPRRRNDTRSSTQPSPSARPSAQPSAQPSARPNTNTSRPQQRQPRVELDG